MAPLCAPGLRVKSATATTPLGGVGGGSDDRRARLWRRRGRAGRPLTSRSPPVSHGSRTSRSPSPYGTRRDGRIRARGRRCPLNVGGGIGRLCSFLAGSTRRLGRGSSHGHTTVMLCPWFTRESPQWARLGRCPPPHQIRKWAVDRTPSSWDTCFLPHQMHDSHALPSSSSPDG